MSIRTSVRESSLPIRDVSIKRETGVICTLLMTSANSRKNAVLLLGTLVLSVELRGQVSEISDQMSQIRM